MSKVLRTVSNSNRNQSTAQYSNENFFINGSRYRKAIFENNSGSSIVLEDGVLLMRNPLIPANVRPITSVSDLDHFIGFAKYNGETTVADAGTVSINYAINGEVDAGLIVLPSGATLNTVVGDGILSDFMNGRGFILTGVAELGAFDN